MIVVDANLLIYAYNDSAPTFAAARSWLEGVLSGKEPVGIPWTMIYAFLRITTDTRIMPAALAPKDAAAVVDEWLVSPTVRVIEPGPRYWSVLRGLLVDGNIRGSLVTDTHLAALAIERGATLCTADRDFRRFPGLRVINPLI